MRIEPIESTVLRIFDAPALDPITVVLIDYGGGRGKLIVEVFGSAWSGYWGAMGGPLLEFLCSCSADYIAGKMTPNDRRVPKREVRYLLYIIEAVLAALKEVVQP